MFRERRLIIGVILVIAFLGVLNTASPVEATQFSGWGIAELIQTDNLEWGLFPQIDVDASGNAVAVWQQTGTTNTNIYSNRFTKGIGWGSPELIETDTSGYAQNSQVAVDPSGNAVAVWHQLDGSLYNVWSNRYTAGTGWGTARLIETDNSGPAQNPQVAVDPSGNAVVVWYQFNGLKFNAYSNRFTKGIGWGSSELIDTDDSGSAFFPQVAVDPSGNAVAVWYQIDATNYNIYSNRFTKGIGWGTAELIETGTSSYAITPKVAVDPSGNAVAVWHQLDGASFNIWSNRYTNGAGWGTAELIETDNSGNAENPQVAVDTTGNATAVWYQSDGTRNNIWSNRFTNGTGWGTARLIETVNSGTAINPQVTIDPSGNALAIWSQSGGTYDHIWSNRYVIPDTTSPSLLLESPSDGLITEEPFVNVYGTTEPGAVLSVNGILVKVRSDGSFSCKISLSNGINTIVATATDTWDNSLTVSRNVTYIDPIPFLLEDMALVFEKLSSLEHTLNLIIDEIGSVWENLNSLNSDLDLTNGNLETLWENLSSLNSDLDLTNGDLETLWKNLSSLKSDLKITGGDIDYILGTIYSLRIKLDQIGESLDSLLYDLNMTRNDIDTVQDSQDSLNSDLDMIENDLDSVEDTVQDSQDSTDSHLDDLREELDDLKLLNIVLIVVFSVIVLVILLILFFSLRRKVNIEKVYYFE